MIMPETILLSTLELVHTWYEESTLRVNYPNICTIMMVLTQIRTWV